MVRTPGGRSVGEREEYRTEPIRLGDVLGQPEALRLLTAMVEEDRFPPALLFVGPPSVGKRLSARALGWAAGCADRTACGRCAGCRANAYGEGLREFDLAAVFADNSIEIKVAALREFLADQARAHSMPRRIVILERADLLNDEMQAALLKSIEEPPPRVTFVLVTQTVSSLTATIRSRSLFVRYRPLSPEVLTAILASFGASEALHPDLLAAAEGSVAKALALREKYADVSELVAAVLERNPSRGSKRADLLESLSLAVPAAASRHPGWREALLELDAAISANANPSLAWSVFRARAAAADAASAGARGRHSAAWSAGSGRGGILAHRPGGDTMGGGL